jgi:hypothetical protein
VGFAALFGAVVKSAPLRKEKITTSAFELALATLRFIIEVKTMLLLSLL